MSDEAAFVRAVQSAPGDDAPRLVYADWLDERGDARGQFLRDEVAAANQFRAGKPAAAKKLRKAAEKVGLEWALSVARPPVGVCTTLKFTKAGKPITAADLDAAEKRARLKLPPDYRAFLKMRNGGEPKPNQFLYDGNESDGPETVEELYPLKPREGLTTVFTIYGGHLDDEDAERAETLLMIGMPGSDEDCLAVSVARNDFGAVYYQPYIEGLQEPTRIADSFAQFLSLIGDHRLEWARMAEDGDAAGLGQWLDAGGDPFVTDPANGFTPLDYAICHGRANVVKAILDRRPRFSRRAAANARDMTEQYEHPKIRRMIDEYLQGP